MFNSTDKKFIQIKGFLDQIPLIATPKNIERKFFDKKELMNKKPSELKLILEKKHEQIRKIQNSNFNFFNPKILIF